MGSSEHTSTRRTSQPAASASAATMSEFDSWMPPAPGSASGGASSAPVAMTATRVGTCTSTVVQPDERPRAMSAGVTADPAAAMTDPAVTSSPRDRTC